MSRYDIFEDFECRDEIDHDAYYYNDYFDWKPLEDGLGHRLLTNFDADSLEIYQEAIRRYPLSKENGLFINKGTHGSINAIWCNLNIVDLSDFWKIKEQIETDIKKKELRKKKIGRICIQEEI